MKPIISSFLPLLLIAEMMQPLHAQSSLHKLLQQAEANYPLLKSKAISIDAAKKNVEVSNSSIIPSLDASYQLDYATYNNITGMSYPQFLTPISGPPSASNNFSGVFGSATSLLLNWQPVTFGQREAQVAYSQAGVNYAVSDAQNEILQHKVRVANAYLDAITTAELINIFKENLSRCEINFSTTKTLVDAGIKPGVDTTLFAAEISKARVDLLNSKKNSEQSIIALSGLLASAESITVSDSSYFNKLPLNYTLADTVKHPLLALYNSSIGLDKAKENEISKTTRPTLGVWGTTYARGSGVQSDGSVKTLDGLGLQRINYGVGLQLSVPLLQSTKIKPQLQLQGLRVKADEEKLNDITLQLSKQLQTADITLNYALAIVKESPLLVQSSRYAYTTMLSRYSAGLANYADVVQAQYNLLKAQTDYKINYMAVWKALLYKATVSGDLNLFLNQVN